MKNILKINWLLEQVKPDPSEVALSHPQLQHIDYPIPKELGSAYYEQLEVTAGCTVFKAEHLFTKKASGQLFPLGHFKNEFTEELFITQTIQGSICCHRESAPKVELIYQHGSDFFRYAKELDLTPLVEASSNSVMCGMSITRGKLNKLIGKQSANLILKKLDLQKPPAVRVATIPSYVSRPIRESLSTSLTGELQKLYAQSKVLEYFCELINYLDTPEVSQHTSKGKEVVHDLKKMLLESEGKIPTLEKLASKYGVSSKKLNDDFQLEFGQSIFTFITQHRLDQAYEALRSTDIPMKSLSAKLGYSHVNNFIAAFTKKFGHAPGMLRK